MLTLEQAKKKAETSWWKGLEAKDIVAFQLYEERLCMPFAIFHAAVATALNDPGISTIAFAYPESLKRRFEELYPEYK